MESAPFELCKSISTSGAPTIRPRTSLTQNNMPFDESGQLHAGTIGLFDDDDEYNATQARLQKNREHAAQRSNPHPTSRSGLLGWISRRFTPSSPSTPVFNPTQRHPQRRTQSKYLSQFQTSPPFSRPSQNAPTPSEIVTFYELEEANNPWFNDGLYDHPSTYSRPPTPSIFYEELGVVRVKSNRPGSWTVVPRDMVRAPAEGVQETYGVPFAEYVLEVTNPEEENGNGGSAMRKRD